jgi:membrane-bound lytic murein transglycosylase B
MTINPYKGSLLMRKSRHLLFLISIAFLAGCAINSNSIAADKPNPPTEQSEPTEEGFAQWVKDFRSEAAQAGISKSTLDSALSGLKLNRKVLKRDAYQPEFVKPIWSYLETAVSDVRVANGQRKYQQHQQLLNTIGNEYGVAPQLITAIWGLETAYGVTFGGYNVIEAFATLGYHGRRSSFAKQQLIAALQIIDNGDIPADQMIGSWAGAMGHTQFIPTSYNERAVDYDNDGKRDIWGSFGDVFASTANYMKNAKWRADETWGAAVILPEGFDWSLADRSVMKPITEWASLGIKPANGTTLPYSAGEAWILLPAGHQGPAFIALPNFRSIMRYNNSTAYALGISMLSDRIAGGEPQSYNWPTSLQALTRQQSKELQQLLTDAGFDTQGIDGILGANSRKALRDWQQSAGLVPDAFATLELLELLRKQ